ncbi:MAG: glycosyltransferase family 4 protein [Pseudomonadota bacterium]
MKAQVKPQKNIKEPICFYRAHKNYSISVLHLTAHLGGGIGKALSGLVLNTHPEAGISHAIVCLELPEKMQFIEELADSGCPVTVAPDRATLFELIEASDIVQLEWWGHPATVSALCDAPLPAMRLLVWCHISGIHTPIIPSDLIRVATRCLFTSPCSYEALEVENLRSSHQNRMDVIHSAGGFRGFELPNRNDNSQIVAGYLGSLNFAKLNPHYVEFLSAVKIPNFTVRMIGDIANRDILENQCRAVNRSGMLEFRGYNTDVASELAAINIFPYLLNPLHYGTTENALLEAMAMGVVPIVLDNPAERYLVTDRKTGLIIRNRDEFADAVMWLANNPEERKKIAMQAAVSIRKRFAIERITERFNCHYESVSEEDKVNISFNSIFGETPAEWFLSSQRNPGVFLADTHSDMLDELALPGLLERSKGSVFHYRKYFPEDPNLSLWCKRLEMPV